MPNEALPNEALPNDAIPDPMEDPKTLKLQTSINRAGTQSWNMLRCATAELERLQSRRAANPATSASKPVSTNQTHRAPARSRPYRRSHSY